MITMYRNYLADLLRVASRLYALREGLSAPQVHLLQILADAPSTGGGWLTREQIVRLQGDSFVIVGTDLNILASRGLIHTREEWDTRHQVCRLSPDGLDLLALIEQREADDEFLRRYRRLSRGAEIKRQRRRSVLGTRILRLLAAGPAQRSTIITILDCSESWITHALADLRAEGVIQSVNGLYSLVEREDGAA